MADVRLPGPPWSGTYSVNPSGDLSALYSTVLPLLLPHWIVRESFQPASLHVSVRRVGSAPESSSET